MDRTLIANAAIFLVLAVIFGLAVATAGGPKWMLAWLRPRQEKEAVEVVPNPVARILTETEPRFGLGFAWFMFVIFTSLVLIFTLLFAENVIAGLLFWIGNILFWGILVIAGMIDQRLILSVYSDALTNIERNILRLEHLQEHANAASAVANAIAPDSNRSI